MSAVAGERSRIARDLHALVTGSVAAMVVQAEGARSELEFHPDGADAAMDALERAGRSALTDLRRILGVLRHSDVNTQRGPQPGVDQIYSMIQAARADGQRVELTVTGSPGTLPAGVELALYRIVQEALASARHPIADGVVVAVQFAETQVQIRFGARADRPSRWPTDAMRERVSLCGGEILPAPDSSQDWQFQADIPLAIQGAPV